MVCFRDRPVVTPFMANHNKTQRLLTDLFQATRSERNGVNKRAFMAQHANDFDEIDELISAGQIQFRDGQNLRLPLLGLVELAHVVPDAESVRHLCAHLFDVLRSVFTQHPDAKLSVSEIAQRAEMPEGQVATAFAYLLDTPILQSWSIGANGLHTGISLSERILKYRSLDNVIEEMRAARRSSERETISYAEEAAHAVLAAIENLTAAGKRAHIRNVPPEAEKLLMQRGRGRIDRAEASGQIQAAIAGLSQSGTIDASVEPHRDWLIKEPLNDTPVTPGPSALDEPTDSPRLPKHPYVDPARLEELKSVTSTKWDLQRLVRMCEELNDAFARDGFITCPMLVRSIVDHVPPIFGHESFGEVANHYAGGRSFRKSMQHLDGSLRPKADGILHTHIRRTESLPTRTQIDFHQDLDLLLGEIVRIVRDEAKGT